MRTEIGNFFMKLRLLRKERLKDMAEFLGVSSAFLSAVENGKKSMPEAWISKIQTEYNLTEDQLDDMKNAALNSQNTITINMENATSSNKDLAVSFARQFDEIDDETSKLIINILKNKKRENS